MSVSQGTINERSFYSKELDETLSLLIYVPAAFSPLFKYSLLIANDGKDYFQMGKLARFADDLLDQHEIDNMIIVGVHYKSIDDRRNKYHPDGTEHRAYIRFLAHELVPWLDQEYPTNAMGKNRTLMGDSLAGTVSLLAAMKYPNVFGQVILHSPYVNQTVLDAVTNQPNPELVEVYQVIGKEEYDVKVSDLKDFLTPNRKLHQLFREKGFDHFYDEFAGGHSWKYWQTDVRRALQMMLS
ncbi:alpha/beta hydrolase-fold protein [Bacillus sp. FJAT-50079]|uniref:alpha/beta hydrolase n=1 Tax=Bacillus sp. FJAT-50079 TaxID=2833577 RepID=UPI001BC8F12C|nr:alpha/beta hydrolase-fold protein [Bacillus sp. FJAT-50079]MBS4207933.1 esterase family protein [Bacillus sp. FJAT-50079]